MVEICAIYSGKVDLFDTKIIHDGISPNSLDASSDAAVEGGRMINANRDLYECLSAEKGCNGFCEPNSKGCRVINVTEKGDVYICNKSEKGCSSTCDPVSKGCEKIN